MRWFTPILVIALLTPPFGTTSGEAFNWEPPNKFIVTLKSLMLKNNTGQWITVAEPDKQVDLFSNQLQVSLFNQGRIPDGNYINFKLIISETIKISESDNFGNKTKAGGVEIISGTAETNFDLPGEITSFVEKSPTWNEEEEGEITATIDFDNHDEDDIIELTKKRDFAQAFEIKKGTFINVVLAMNLMGTCYMVEPGALKPGVPEKKVMMVFPPRFVNEVRFTVDDRTELLEADDVLMKF